MATGNDKLLAWDYVAIAIYFVVVLGAGIYSLFRANRGTVSGYFLAGRLMTWLPVGASIFASNIGSEHFIGLAGSGATSGIGVGAFEINALIFLQLLGWVFLPVYIASGACTLPEYLKKRFGGTRLRVFLSVLSLFLYIFTKISVNLYSGALYIQQSLNWDLYLSIGILLLLTAFFTITGGLAAVMYTDTVQTIIMVGGAGTLAILSWKEIGSYANLERSYMMAIPNTTRLVNGSTYNTGCGVPRVDSFIMLRDPVTGDIPWPGFLFGQTAASIWYWCTDQMMVQRTLAAKNLSHAQGGVVLAGFLKTLPVWLLVIPGMISRVLYTDEVACVDPEVCQAVCGSESGCSNVAYVKLVLNLMPTGMKGLIMAVMLAALMSDLTSIFNSASTLFTIDIWKRVRKQASSRELLHVGRVFVLVMVAISVAWIPVITVMQSGQLYHYIQAVAGQLSPPVAAIYILAILWPRCNEKGAFIGVCVGVAGGVTRMILEFIYPAPPCYEEDNRPAIVRKIHYMYVAMILFFVTLVVTVVVSILTKPEPEYRTIRTTFWSRYDHTERADEMDYDVGTKEPLRRDGTEMGDLCTLEQNNSLEKSRRAI
ncbi:PREDICTED: sodium/myo-inositol cotransporter-like [Priapulus caudatus]|uniref:Sodium/myo-inositol cotransporter-like n=1 Tax=Priapulus caudatus TaxID=37621 RepID=A0ABM1EGI5_PRICU|nr:PREDICTED: sodium/myo-inositol cotransporter-like [Priapulus caudatus]